jgi:site-specific DNA-methyltransferase (adenine-specific)
LASYLKTKFVRFLISLQKYTQHLYSERFSFVPSLSLDKDWTDHELAGYFNLTPEEVEFIDAMIRPMDGSVE